MDKLKRYYKTYSAFERDRDANSIPRECIVFIEDRHLIYTHGHEFGGAGGLNVEELQNYLTENEYATLGDLSAYVKKSELRTINGQSLVGSGDIVIQTQSTSVVNRWIQITPDTVYTTSSDRLKDAINSITIRLFKEEGEDPVRFNKEEVERLLAKSLLKIKGVVNQEEDNNSWYIDQLTDVNIYDYFTLQDDGTLVSYTRDSGITKTSISKGLPFKSFEVTWYADTPANPFSSYWAKASITVNRDASSGEGGSGEPGLDGENAISVQILSDKGMVIKNKDLSPYTLTAHVFDGKEEITSKVDPSAFNWKRVSSDVDYDSVWNSKHAGVGNTISINILDVPKMALFDCEVTTTN